MLKWNSPDEDLYVKGPRTWDAEGGDGYHYRITGPMLKSDVSAQTIQTYYEVARNRPTKARIAIANDRIGEAPTLNDAKAMAERQGH